MSANVSEYILNNHLGLKLILQSHLDVISSENEELLDIIILKLVPTLKKVNTIEDLYPILKLELLNCFKESEIPSKDGIRILSQDILKYYKEVYRDKKSEFINKLHSFIGISLIVLNISYFIYMEFVFSKGFGMGVFSFIIGILFFLMPSVSGYFAIRKNINTLFNTTHFFWLLLNILLMCFYIIKWCDLLF